MKQNQDSCDSVINANSNTLLQQKEKIQQLEKQRETLKNELQIDKWNDLEREIRNEFDDIFNQ